MRRSRKKKFASRRQEGVVRRGTTCQVCGSFREVARNGKLPPHKCAVARPKLPSSPARRIIDTTDDGLSSFIRQICYGQGLFRS